MIQARRICHRAKCGNRKRHIGSGAISFPVRILFDVTVLALLAFAGLVLFAAIEDDWRMTLWIGRIRGRFAAWARGPSAASMI